MKYNFMTPSFYENYHREKAEQRKKRRHKTVSRCVRRNNKRISVRTTHKKAPYKYKRAHRATYNQIRLIIDIL